MRRWLMALGLLTLGWATAPQAAHAQDAPAIVAPTYNADTGTTGCPRDTVMLSGVTTLDGTQYPPGCYPWQWAGFGTRPADAQQPDYTATVAAPVAAPSVAATTSAPSYPVGTVENPYPTMSTPGVAVSSGYASGYTPPVLYVDPAGSVTTPPALVGNPTTTLRNGVYDPTSYMGAAATAATSYPGRSTTDVAVGGYTRANGTYVAPYTRTAADSTTLNNFSTRGNTNPYTGAPGTRRP